MSVNGSKKRTYKKSLQEYVSKCVKKGKEQSLCTFGFFQFSVRIVKGTEQTNKNDARHDCIHLCIANNP